MMANCMLYRWQALNAQGEYLQGDMLVQEHHDLLQLMAEHEYSPLGYKRCKIYRPRDWHWSQKITLMRQLATLLKAGMTISDGLRLLSEGHSHAGWRALLSGLHNSVAQGNPFSQVLMQWPMIFPPLFPALMHVGEITGKLDECCLQLAHQQERQQQLQKKVLKALRYPLFILLAALAVTAGMLLFVLPEFVAIYRAFDAPLPAFTALVIALSEGVQQCVLPLILTITLAGVIWRRQHTHSVTWQRNEQLLLLRVPLISSLYRGSQLSQIFTTLTLTQQAGLTLLHSFEAVEKTLNHQLWREAINQLQRHIAAGKPLYQAIAGHMLFTPLCHQLIKVGEESGALDVLLNRLAQWHEENTHELADTLAATLEPLMMIVTGMLVGALVVAMYLPIFGLGDALG